MRRPFWEIAAFALPLLLGLVLCAVDVVRPFGPGTVGLERSRYVPGPFVVRVESLRDGTPATRAGIRAGNELRVDEPRPAFALLTVKAGQTIGVVPAVAARRSRCAPTRLRTRSFPSSGSRSASCS